MKASALQEFLRSLSSSLAPVGVPARSLEDLRRVGEMLDPFQDLDLAQLADFLHRAAEYRRSGAVPVVSVAGLDVAAAAARQLGEMTQAFATASASPSAELETRVAELQGNLQAALEALAAQFGLTAKLTRDKKWLAGLRARAEVARATEGFRGLASQITGPESYQSEAVKAAIRDVAAIDAKSLKAAAAELGVSGTGTGEKFVQTALVKLTGIDNKPPKGAKKAKPAEPVAPPEQVEAMVRTLQEMVDRAKDPTAVPDAEIDAILARVSGEFSTDQQKEIAKRVTGTGGRSAKDAVDRLRADLTAVKRLLESQRV